MKRESLHVVSLSHMRKKAKFVHSAPENIISNRDRSQKMSMRQVEIVCIFCESISLCCTRSKRYRVYIYPLCYQFLDTETFKLLPFLPCASFEVIPIFLVCCSHPRSLSLGLRSIKEITRESFSKNILRLLNVSVNPVSCDLKFQISE